MSSSGQYLSPIGGIAVPSHRVAAIVIAAVGYGPLVLFACHRLQRRGTHSLVSLGAAIVAVERIILLSLHAIASTNVKWRTSIALTKYSEISLGLAYIVIANDAISLLRLAQDRSASSQSSRTCISDVKEARKGLAVAGALGIFAGGFYRFNLEWPGAAARLIIALSICRDIPQAATDPPSDCVRRSFTCKSDGRRCDLPPRRFNCHVWQLPGSRTEFASQKPDGCVERRNGSTFLGFSYPSGVGLRRNSPLGQSRKGHRVGVPERLPTSAQR